MIPSAEMISALGPDMADLHRQGYPGACGRRGVIRVADAKNKYIYGSVAEKAKYEQQHQVQDSYASDAAYDPYEENAVLKSKKKARNNAKLKTKILLNIFLVFGMCAIIMFRYAQISQINYDSNKLNSEYTALQNENARISIEIEKAMDLNSIRETAEAKLKMHKPTKSQIVYVSVPKEDVTILATKQQSKVLSMAKELGNSFKKVLEIFY